MIRVTAIVPDAKEVAADGVLVLPFDTRSRSRFRTQLPDGREVGVFLKRGSTLRDGEHVLAQDGLVFRIAAAPEAVSTARSRDRTKLLRAAYHLGNRHVALQLLPGGLRYLHDHVLDEMLREMGLVVSFENAPFEPEAGAYHGHGHGHSHGHGHEHGNGHGHD